MTNKYDEQPELAVLDGDIIVYRAACWADKVGATEDELRDRIAFDVHLWTPVFTPRMVCALSCKSEDNYRREVYPEYKANRKGKPRPVNLSLAGEIMREDHPVVTRDRLEADDLIGLGMSSGLAVGVSLDKDIESCPGWFWNPDKMCFPVVISEQLADEFFYKQWLMGDSTDGIPGAKLVGKVKAGKIVEENKPDNIVPAVLKEYEVRGHDYDYCVTMARLVRILRDGEYDRETGEITLYDPLPGQ